jgi:hypothetical protein
VSGDVQQRFITQVVPTARIVRKFTCSGLAIEQPDSNIACYRAGHECRSTWERLEDEHGVYSRSFCGCCGDEYGSMDLPWPMVRDDDEPDPDRAGGSILDRVNGHLDRVRELGEEVLQIADRMDERNERRCSCGGDHNWPQGDGESGDE